MELKLEVEINSTQPDEINQLCTLIREGWNIGRIEKEAQKDRANKDMLFILIR
jgi:hypothetical protein